MKLAVFDIDGTLTKTVSVDADCYVRAFADTHGISGINTNWAEYAHATDSAITLQVFKERLGRAPDADELLRLKQCFVSLLKERYMANSALFAELPGASTALLRLGQESGWAIAIAAGSWCESARLKLEAVGIELEGLPAAFADDGVSREEIVQGAISKALALHQQASFEKVVSIGDALWDVHTARRLNLAFLGVGSGEYAAVLRRAGVCHIVEDFRDYDCFLRYLNDARVPKSRITSATKSAT